MSRKTSQPSPRRRPEGKLAGGTPADRLMRAWHDQDDEAFAEQAAELIAKGRDGVLSTALRKYGERYEDEAVEEFAQALTEIAEVVEAGPGFDVAQLVLLPILATGPLPDPTPLAAGLAGSGVFPPEAELTFLAGWRAAEPIGELSPVALRRLLLDVIERRPPGELPPLAEATVPTGTVAVLVGALIFRAPDATDDADDTFETLEEQLDAEAESSFARFTAWRETLTAEQSGGGLLLAPCAPSELEDQLYSLLEAPDDGAIEEILDFVEAAREEAGDEAIEARLAARDDGLEITVLTEAGRVLDSRLFEAGEAGPLNIQAVRDALEGRVAVSQA